jgi:hypothetical protein
LDPGPTLNAGKKYLTKQELAQQALYWRDAYRGHTEIKNSGDPDEATAAEKKIKEEEAADRLRDFVIGTRGKEYPPLPPAKMSMNSD